jgi:hypothetical protein
LRSVRGIAFLNTLFLIALIHQKIIMISVIMLSKIQNVQVSDTTEGDGSGVAWYKIKIIDGTKVE